MRTLAALLLAAPLSVLLASGSLDAREKSPFEAPERTVTPSPARPSALALGAGETAVDFEVSPGGGVVALEVKGGAGYEVRLWTMGAATSETVFRASPGTTLKGLTWHPGKERTLFLLAAQGSEHRILRLEEKGGAWATGVVLSSGRTLRRIVAGSRPSIWWAEGGAQEGTRVYYGAALPGGAWAIRSVTERGTRDVQIVGPKATMDRAPGDEENPSSIVAASALPLGFHPAGDRLLWEDGAKGLHDARFQGSWSEDRPLLGGKVSGGTATWLANGLAVVVWRPGTPGVTLHFEKGPEPLPLLSEWTLAGTPSNVPDGRGFAFLTKEKDGRQTLRFVPAAVPAGDVMNAWMFVTGKDDLARLVRDGGLFRPTEADQLYALYEEELYAGGSAQRPFVVTTDVFWESFGAAFRGLFMLRERAQAIPAFWEFVEGARAAHSGPSGSKLWGPVFTAAAALGSGKPASDPEAARILALKTADSPVVGPRFDYGEMKPRGNYAASAKLKSYFMAFRYLTEVARREVERRPPAEKARALDALATLPPAVKAKAMAWIGAYEPFIAPGRGPVAVSDRPFVPPPYAAHLAEGPALFPLSFGFDNEVFLTTVFHELWPAAEQIQDARNRRLLPSGLDLAAVTGSALARSLLGAEVARYPNLAGAIDRLAASWRKHRPAFARSPSLYDRWLDALAVQWADDAVASAASGKELWRAKRLQTGLASFTNLRHTTVLVNERTAAEAGEGGWEEIVPRPPRGWVEADPAAFEAVAALFDAAAALVKDERFPLKGSVPAEPWSDAADAAKAAKAEPLRQGILKRLGEASGKARLFAGIARKQLAGQAPSAQEYEEIYRVGRVAEHHFLVFASLANEELALSNPDPVAKVVDVAGGSGGTGYLLMGVGRPLEWTLLVPYFGRREAVRGPVSSYYEVTSPVLLDDEGWRRDLAAQKRPAWVSPFVGASAPR